MFFWNLTSFLDNRFFKENFLLIFILLSSFVVRMFYLDPYYSVLDVQRDYFIANHIVSYGEFPLLGPIGGGGLVSVSTPFYYYFLALFLLIKNSILFLHLVNVFFQTALVLSIYLLAKNMFSKSTGFIAAVLFGFSQVTLSQSIHIYAPYISQFFLYCSFLLLLLAHNKKSFNAFFGGIVAYVLSFSLYGLNLILAPIIFLFGTKIIKDTDIPAREYIKMLIAVSCILFIIYLPTVVYFYQNDFGQEGSSGLFQVFLDKFNNASPRTLYNLSVHLQYLAGSFLPISNASHSFIGGTQVFTGLIIDHVLSKSWLFLLFILIVVGVIHLLTSKTFSRRKIFFLITLTTIMFYVVLVASLKVAYVAVWHYTPILGLFSILIAEAVNSVCCHYHNFYKLASIAFIFSSVCISPLSIEKLTDQISKPPIYKVRDALIGEIELISQKDKRGINFFDIEEYLKSIGGSSGYFLTNPFFWNEIERHFDTRFTKILNTNSLHVLDTINSKKYIFLICQTSSAEGCTVYFSVKHPAHLLEKEIYKDDKFIVYLTRHSTDF